MGRREIFHTFSLLVEIEGHFAHEFVNYVCETEDWPQNKNFDQIPNSDYKQNDQKLGNALLSFPS
jgi:hypothetical protein